MKRLFIILSIFIFTFMTLSQTVLASTLGVSRDISLNINGQRTVLNVAPLTSGERTFVPVRGICEKLGATVDWVNSERKVIVRYENNTLQLWINKKQISVNGALKSMDVAPFIKNDSTMVPIRFLAENMGMIVGWYGPTSLVTVTSPSYLTASGNKMVLGFTTNDYAGDHYSLSSLKKNTDNVNTVATFSYGMDAKGGLTLTGLPQKDTVSYVNENQLKPLVLIHNLVDQAGFSSSLAHTVLSDSGKRKALIGNILLKIVQEQYAGVNIDVENVDAADRANYTAFIQELKTALSPLGYMTTVSIPAKTSDMKTSRWSGAYDYAAIGKYAERILLMTYDEHYFGGPAGPVASAPWVKNVLTYATSVIPSQKILLGIPGYGYDWSSAGTKVVTFNGVEKVLASGNTQVQWDDTAKSPYYNYTDNGIRHEVWFENSQSLAYKLGFVTQYKLGGIGIWKLGFDNQNFWAAIRENLG